jgi:hypothetical protein
MDELPIQLPPGGVDRIISFLGYGQLSDSTWFIGIEEGLGDADSEEAMANLKARTKFAPIMDLREAHLHLREGGGPIDIETKTSFTPVWVWMAKIMRAHEKHGDWRDTERANDYVRHQLGRDRGRTFLTELSPIPSAKAHDKKWMSLFTRLDPALASKLKQRKESLRRELKESAPSLVICYGAGREPSTKFAELLAVKWEPLFSGVSGAQDTKYLLLPFFGLGWMSHEIIQSLLDRGIL